MTERSKAQISHRKSPKQSRSRDLVAAILEAAVRVLESEGAARFTTARVAERAGISVGSLYQYFPNKAAILYRLQSDEWAQTLAQWREILEDRATAPSRRLQRLVQTFLRSECLEAAVRGALNDAAPLYVDAPEIDEGDDLVARFLEEALPRLDQATRARAASLIELTLTEVGQAFSETARTGEEIAAYAEAMADMFDAYLLRFDGWR